MSQHHRTAYRQVQLIVSMCLAFAAMEASALAQVGDSGSSGDVKDPLPEQADKVQALLQEGNELADNYQFDKAASKYREGLELWDHPILHFNLGLALTALGRTLDAYQHITLAVDSDPSRLREGDGSGHDNHRRAVALQRELRQKLAGIELFAAHDDVRVSVNDTSIAVNGGEQIMNAGMHRVVVEKAGHRTMIQSIELHPNQSYRFQLTSDRPFTPWKPWVVTGVGALATVTGLTMWSLSYATRDELAKQVVDCTMVTSCNDLSLVRRWTRAKWQSRIGLGALIIGGGTLLTGVVLVAWNRQRRLRMIPSGDVTIAPVVSLEMTGFVGTLSY